MARLFTPSESKYYLMALDAGTGSIRAVIFDLEGNQIAVGQAEWRHLAVPDVPSELKELIRDRGYRSVYPVERIRCVS
ncbi:autoinducer 2 kinase LsrK [Escherichia coli UMEA 3899-1]|nr:autoinducer 2 kinase LsrK [Escherichia coli UMEA 3899-1]